MPLWIVVPSVRSRKAFLARFGLDDIPAVEWGDLSRRFLGVPSIALVDSTGVIRRIWAGELKPEAQAEVLAAIRDPGGVTLPKRKLTNGELMLSQAELASVTAPGDAVLISTCEREEYQREHPSGAINIPLRELGMRADRELKKHNLIVIDCSALHETICSIAVERLRSMGFRTAAADLARIE